MSDEVSPLAADIKAALEHGGHIGRHNAVSRHALQDEMRINVSDRTFRRIYNSDDCAALVCDDGLFLPAHWYEVEDCIRYLAPHMSGKKLEHRAAVLTLAYHELMTRDVGPLFGSVHGFVEVKTAELINDFNHREVGA